ncbi:MAG: 4-(cytidine 5'-diphospho)-2-C-methyl-D-erythritol kinase [Ignavibacteria bacterium]|jgi:4-diphosphocytidyl-2-C-methyl-D-erythritol kinase
MKQHPLTLRACVKINIGLDVLRKRPDGFHDIQSIFVALDMHDTIVFEPQPQLEVVCIPAVTDSPDSNIVAKAARAYATAFPNDAASAKITVNKGIPTGAGLGGGSSDAASTLLGLAYLNGRPHTTELINHLEPLAQMLGSDVPFFLRYGVAHVRGRGEHVSRLDDTFPWCVLLVCPGIHVNTAHAYSTLGITGEQPQSDLLQSWRQAIDAQVIARGEFTNDFERSVFTEHPILATIKSSLYEHGANYASMSGSGSTMFGLFTSVDKAVDAQGAFEGLQTYICAPVTEAYRIL